MRRILLCIAVTLFCISPSQATPDRREATDLFTIAQKAFDDKLYLSASKKFNEFLRRFNTSPRLERAQLRLGQSLFHLKNWRRAQREFELVIKKTGADTTDAHFWLGRTLYEMKNYREAEKELLEILPLFVENPQEATLLFTLGMSQFQSGDYVKAVPTFAVMIKKHPSNASTTMAALKIPESDYKRKQYEKAIRGFKHYIKSYSSSKHIPQALYYLGESYYNTFAWADAISSYTQILDHPKTSPKQRANALYSLGWAEDKNNNLPQSLMYFTRFKETGQSDIKTTRYARKKKPVTNTTLIPLVNFKIGEIYFKLGKYDKALPYFAKLQSHKMYGQRATAWQAEALYFQGKYKSAQLFYDSILQNKKSPLYAEALRGKGRCYINLGDYAAATLLFQEAIENSTSIKNIVESRRALAQISRLRGRIDNAITQINDILSEYGHKIPRDEFLLYLGDLHFDKHEYDKAEEQYRAVISRYPLKNTSIQAQHHLGDLMRGRGRFDLAAVAYAKIQKMTHANKTQQENASYYQGLSLYNSHQYHEAEMVFRAALSAHPTGLLPFEFNRNIINCLVAKEEFSKAESSFKTMIQTFEDRKHLSSLLYDFAMFYYEQNSYLKSRVQFRRLTEEFPHSNLADESHYYLGKSAAALGLNKQALEEWETLSSKKESEFHHLVALDIVELLISEKRFDEALRKTSAFLTRTTDPSQKQELSFLEGKILYALKDWRNAITSFKAVVSGSKNHTSMVAETLMADAYIYARKDYENASLHYMNAIYLYKQDDDTFIQTSLKLARTFIQLKQYDQATKIIKKAYSTKTKIGPEGQLVLDEIETLVQK